jgi:hypothetical protein
MPRGWNPDSSSDNTPATAEEGNAMKAVLLAGSIGTRIEEEPRGAAVAEAMSWMWGEGAGWEIDGGRHPQEARVHAPDSTKACRRLG